MENLDVVVLKALQRWRAAGRRALLATVVRTWGSSPRPVGSTMALCEDGAIMGSVSGGCVEDDLMDRYTRAHLRVHSQVQTVPVAPADSAAGSHAPWHSGTGGIPSGPPTFVQYGITADEAHRFGLPCGGTLELLLEYDPDPVGLAELLALLQSGHLVQRTVRLPDGAATLQRISSPQGLTVDALQLTNTFGPAYRMLIIGAGQIAEYLATMALFSGFAVTVCDPREEYRASWCVPGATVVSEMPDDVVQAFQPDRRTCVVALTHDPKLDDLALLEALQTDAFYVGGIGSRRNNEMRHARMMEHFDQTEESLARLRGPIGIYIGSKTPPEIAVSIMAEILAVKNGVALPRDMAVAQAKNERELPHNDPGVLVCAVR